MIAMADATNKVDALNHAMFNYAYDADNRLKSRWTPEKGNTFYVLRRRWQPDAGPHTRNGPTAIPTMR